MRQWPWITIVLAVIVFLNPVGQDFIYSAFFSNKQLSRNIAQPFVYAAIVILIALGALEFWLKRHVRRRRLRRAAC